MQTTLNEQDEIIVRDSPEYYEYMKNRHGWHVERVKKLETNLAIWGRPLLLAYVVYTVVKASVIHSLPLNNNAVKFSLLAIEAFMLVLQVLGLEGGMPGLIHLKDEMETKGKKKEADQLQFALKLVTAMLVATGIDIVLQSLAPTRFALPLVGVSLDSGALIATYTNLLLIGRIAAVAYYLTSMARLSHKGPRIISKEEAQKQADAKEQKQIRIDNANIMAVVQKAIDSWAATQPDANTLFSESVSRINEVLSRKLESVESAQKDRIDSLKRYVESAQIGSAGSGSLDAESVALQIESALSRSLADLSRQVESKLADLSRQVNRVEAETARQITTALRTQQSSSPASPQSAMKAPEKPKGRSATSSEEKLTVEEVVARIEADPTLLNLSGQQLADRLNTSKPTANRAKTRYVELHPESAQVSTQHGSESAHTES